MQIDIKNSQDLQTYIGRINNNIEQNHKQAFVKYVILGSKTVRLVGYSNKFLPFIERQLTYTLRDKADHFDATIVMWNEQNPNELSKNVLGNSVNPHRLRLEKIMTKIKNPDFFVIDKNYSLQTPVIGFENERGVVFGYDEQTETHYYGVKNLDPEEFIKEGHILVQFFNKITKTPTSALVHGAAVGIDGEGVLFCARGQRGKSTLSVLSMMSGFDYVSDDYLILEQEDDALYSYPIYSIITLSPRMYNELYDKLEGSRFLSNNSRKDKYIVNIANYHHTFKEKYPIKFCMFPEIVSDAEPSIVPCPKGRAITQLIQSTTIQLQDMHNQDVIKKMMDMISGYEFFQINLCQDIQKNTECLRAFMKNYNQRKQKTFIEDKMYVDVSFDIGYILDSEKHIIYLMNELSTNIYENLMNGVAKEKILSQLMAVKNMPATMEKEFNALVTALEEKQIVKASVNAEKEPNIKQEFAKKCNYRLSCYEYTTEKNNNLISDYKKEK